MKNETGSEITSLFFFFFRGGGGGPLFCCPVLGSTHIHLLTCYIYNNILNKSMFNVSKCHYVVFLCHVECRKWKQNSGALSIHTRNSLWKPVPAGSSSAFKSVTWRTKSLRITSISFGIVLSVGQKRHQIFCTGVFLFPKLILSKSRKINLQTRKSRDQTFTMKTSLVATSPV